MEELEQQQQQQLLLAKSRQETDRQRETQLEQQIAAIARTKREKAKGMYSVVCI